MIPSSPNPTMTREEIKHFQAQMSRKMKGAFTPYERELYNRAKESYDLILKNNGGKNPFFEL